MGKGRRLVVRPPVPPMLARTVAALPAGPGWLYEPKVDGFRVLAFHGKTGVELQSRQQRMLTPHFPDIAAAVGGLAKEAVLDGEVVIWQADRFDFAALQDRLRSGPRRAPTLAAALPAAYVVFDLLALGRTDLRGQRLAPRVPGSIVAVVVSIVVSAATDAAAHGVTVVGAVQRGFPPIGLPEGSAGVTR